MLELGRKVPHESWSVRWFGGVSGRIRLLMMASGALLMFVGFQFVSNVYGQLGHFERERQALRYLSAMRSFSFMLLEQKKVPLSGFSAQEKSLFIPWLEDVERDAVARWDAADRALALMEANDAIRQGHDNLHARWLHLSTNMLGMHAADIEWEFLGLRREMDVQMRRITEFAAMGAVQTTARFQLWGMLSRDLPRSLNAIDAWRGQLNASLRQWDAKHREALGIAHALLSGHMDDMVINVGLVMDAGGDSQTQGAVEAIRSQVNGLDSQLRWILDAGPDEADVIDLYAGASHLLDAVQRLFALHEGSLYQKINAEQSALLWESLATLAAGVLALTFILMWFLRLARGITRPLNELRQAATQLAGDRHSLWETVPEEGSGLTELRELAAAFNVLAEDVHTREAQLAEQHRFMEQLHMTQQEGVLVLDREGRVTRANPAALEILCTNEDEVLHQPIEALFDDLPQNSALEQWLANVHMPGLQLLRGEGDVPFWRAFWRTEEPLLLLRNGKRLAAANPAAEHILEYAASALVGMPVSALFPDMDSGMARAVNAALAAGDPGLSQHRVKVQMGDGCLVHLPVTLCPTYSEESPLLALCLSGGTERRQGQITGSARDIEWRYLRAGGEVRNLLLSSSTLRDAVGMVNGVVVTLKDVSELSAMQEREALRLQMDNQSRLATLGEMATGVAHEINQPLTYISATIQTLQRVKKKNLPLDDDKMLEMLAESGRQVGRITRIISHLRVFGRDHSTEPPQPVYWPQVLDDALILLSEKLHLHNIALVQEIEPDLPSVRGNPNEFEQVLINLLQNAIDALEGRKDGQIHVTMRRLGDKLEIVFADNGTGMPEAVRVKCFEPFYTTKVVGKGTGIGLSLVHGIVTRHEGTIGVVSEPGHGTRFVLRFPVVLERT